MWVFTRYGFFSAVRKGKDIQVRARQKLHLEALRIRFSIEAKVIVTPKADYKYRVVLAPDQWTMIAAQLAKEVDYENFKSEVFRNQGRTDYEAVLHKVWELMHRLQVQEPAKRRQVV